MKSELSYQKIVRPKLATLTEGHARDVEAQKGEPLTVFLRRLLQLDPLASCSRLCRMA